MESETKLPQIGSANNFNSTGKIENNNLVNGHSQKTLAIVKKARKQVEDDARLLANRIALLKQEEIKTLKKIEETKKKALEIYQLKKKNEEKLKMKGLAKEKQLQELKEKTQAQKEQDRILKEEKKQIFEQYKMQHVEQIRKMKEMQKKKRLYLKNKSQEELQLKHQIVNQQKFLGRQKFDDFFVNKVKQFQQENEQMVQQEENFKIRKEQEILRMEKLEMELIQKLQTSQLLQKHAYEELENALTLPANEFAKKHLGKKNAQQNLEQSLNSSNNQNQNQNQESDQSQSTKFNNNQNQLVLNSDGKELIISENHHDSAHQNQEKIHDISIKSPKNQNTQEKEKGIKKDHSDQKDHKKDNIQSENKNQQSAQQQKQQQQQSQQENQVSIQKNTFPQIKSTLSLAYKYATQKFWNQYYYCQSRTKTSKFSFQQCIQVSIELDNQHVGIYAGDADCYYDFMEVFHPLILDYHKLSENFTHTPNMDYSQITVKIEDESPIESTRIRVARNINGYGLSPGITQPQRIELEELVKKAFQKFQDDLKGDYYPLNGMSEETRQKLVDDHFLFTSGDNNLKIAGMERDWPEGRGIFHNESKTALVWVNEEDQLRIISMQKGGNVNQVFERLVNLIKNVENFIQSEGKSFAVHEKYGYLTSCPSNLGTGMRASVHVHLPGWLQKGTDKLKERCKALGLQPRGARGESGGDTGDLFDISNKYRLGYSEVDLVKMMIDGVNTLIKEDKELQAKIG